MDAECSWTSLLRPGEATDHFTAAPRARPLSIGGRDFNPSHAWWLAELSRLIYRNQEPEHGPGRHALLRAVGMEERFCLDGIDGRCALIGMQPESGHVGTVLVFCGTRGIRNGFSDLNAPLVAWRGPGRVHRGFRALFEKAWPQIEGPLSSMADPLFCTGHSMGGALASLVAAGRTPAALYTFGAPRVGNRDFVEALRVVPSFRIVNASDIVATLPPVLPALPYAHAGELHHLTRPGADVDPEHARDSWPALVARWLTWSSPPAPLADHAPVNYVAGLEELLASRA